MARVGPRTTEVASADSPLGPGRRVFNLDPARLELGSNRVGGLEILGLTSLRPGCDAFCDPALERRIRGPLRGQDVEQGARNALERAKGRCRAPCPLRTIELALGGPYEIEERRDRPRRIQIVIERGSNVVFQFSTQLTQWPVSRFSFPVFRQTGVKLAESPDALFRRLECVVGEVDGLPIMRLEEEQANGGGIHTLLSQVSSGEKISVAFRHLGAAYIQELAVHPMARELLARRTLRLRDLVFVMRENEIDAAGVDIERLNAAALPDLVERHRRAFEVPARAPAPKWGIPDSTHRFSFGVRLLPQCKVARVTLRVFVTRDARADFDLTLVEL